MDRIFEDHLRYLFVYSFLCFQKSYDQAEVYLLPHVLVKMTLNFLLEVLKRLSRQVPEYIYEWM